jgi:hypothetical protein
MKSFIFFIAGIVSGLLASAQVSIGSASADSSALLELSAVKKGLLLPRVSQTQRAAVAAPANGLLFYQHTSPEGFYNLSRSNAVPAWHNLSTYALQQNLQLGAYRIVHNRATARGLSATGSKIRIYSTTEAVSGNTIDNSLLGIYNTVSIGNNIDLVSFKNLFGLSMLSWKLNGALNELTLFQKSTNGDIPRLTFARTGLVLGTVSLPFDLPPLELNIDGNLRLSGNLDVGMEYVSVERTLDAHTTASIDCQCIYKENIGGGGGLRDAGSNQNDIEILYSGPSPDSRIRWRMVVRNSSGNAKVIRVYAICARIATN